MREDLIVSVSGGRTSGYMAWWISRNLSRVCEYLNVSDLMVHYVFANTGREHPDTLRFVEDLSEIFGLHVTWVEAVISPEPKVGTRHRRVGPSTAHTFADYHKPSHPFRQLLEKHGVPNAKLMHCTEHLKRQVIRSYARYELQLKPEIDHWTAIGIRADEPQRRAVKSHQLNLVYPLLDWNPTTREDVDDWWDRYNWNLAIPKHLGNCITCHKKSFATLKTVWQDMPEEFEFNRWAEKEYGHVAKRDGDTDRVFFRCNTNTERLLHQFTLTDAPDQYRRPDSCSESCEAY